MALERTAEREYKGLTPVENAKLNHAVDVSCFLHDADRMGFAGSGRFQFLDEKRKLLMDYFHKFNFKGRDYLGNPTDVPDEKIGGRFEGVYASYNKKRSEYLSTVFRLSRRIQA
ncbi:hypothetical protein JW826_01760 [Candidatus Woesearchaeota archaeon]|nr:hypothetical protein [Candidatus Woesearchaeota archaeon]